MYGNLGFERLPVARKQINVAILFDCNRTVAIQLQLVLPEFAFGNRLDLKTFHWRFGSQRRWHFLHQLKQRSAAKTRL
jgi:hypothetical protein